MHYTHGMKPLRYRCVGQKAYGHVEEGGRQTGAGSEPVSRGRPECPRTMGSRARTRYNVLYVIANYRVCIVSLTTVRARVNIRRAGESRKKKLERSSVAV